MEDCCQRAGERMRSGVCTDGLFGAGGRAGQRIITQGNRVPHVLEIWFGVGADPIVGTYAIPRCSSLLLSRVEDVKNCTHHSMKSVEREGIASCHCDHVVVIHANIVLVMSAQTPMQTRGEIQMRCHRWCDDTVYM
jgi:hypothetical protein